MSALLVGGCLCGAIRYTVSEPVTALRACHCTHCQKASGTYAAVNFVLPREKFALTQGTPKRYATTPDRGGRLFRYFCGECGSPLYSHREDTPERIVVRAGTLDDSSGMRITANIWTRSARAWGHIDPGTDCHPGNPPLPAPPKA